MGWGCRVWGRRGAAPDVDGLPADDAHAARRHQTPFAQRHRLINPGRDLHAAHAIAAAMPLSRKEPRVTVKHA
ncbi:hypothetical protein WK52_12265 [Burkholderia multivorans]|nr:hypothetical protein WK52_12265 [Burkholderia multivorans]